MSASQIAAVILAAGASTRLGQPKQLVHVAGSALVHRTAKIAINSGCSPVLVVLGANAQFVNAALETLPVICIKNSDWRNGVGTSIACGVRAAATSDPAGCIILPCDHIKLTNIILVDLINRFKNGDVRAVASSYNGTIGTPTLFENSLFDQLMSLKGDNGAKTILRSTFPTALVNFPGGELDLDTKEQLKVLSR